MLDIRVVNLHKSVFLGQTFEIFSTFLPFITRLLLEDCAKFFLGFLNIIEWRPLVHTCLSNSSVTSQYNVQISVGVMDQL